MNQTDKNGYSALHIATYYKSAETLRALRNAKIAYGRALNGYTPLHLAIKYNNMACVKFFVEEWKVNINEAKDKATGKMTPFNVAIQKGSFDIADYLLSKRATINPESFYLACKHPNIPFAQMILSKFKEQSFSYDTIQN